MRTNLSYVVVAMVSAGAGLFACGGGSGPSGAAPEADAGTDGNVVTKPVEAGVPAEAAPPPVDHGAPSSTYPAFPVSVGLLQDNGGPKLKAPVIVPITWNSDPSQAGFDTFADELGATAYWKTAVGEWGVGPATSGAANHVHLTTAAPATLTESQATSDFQTMITTNAGVAGSGWPAATPETIYAFFLPPSTSLLMDSGFGGGGPSDACSQGIGGYHMAATSGTVTAAYAVVPSCNFGGGNSATQQTTMSMSHELGEAATDPFGQNPGVVGFDNFAYTYFQQLSEENGDACEFFVQGPDSSFYEEKETTPAPFDYWVQRLWSNKSAAAGHNPCIPAPADPYFNVTPLDLQTVNVSLPPQLTGSSSAQNQPTKGYKVLAGSSGKFAVGFFSDAPTSGPWTIAVTSGNPLAGGGGIGSFNKSSLAMKIDKTSGTNGEKAWIDVTVTTSGSAFKGELITVESRLNGVSHYMPIWIAGQ